MIVFILTPEAFNKIMQAFVDRVAEDAIAEAKAYVEVQELKRIVNLQE